ncbi:hypothetical protein ACTXT7_001408 [Hymenolepis weldensis]
MSRHRCLGVMIDICLGTYVQTRKHIAGPPVDTILPWYLRRLAHRPDHSLCIDHLLIITELVRAPLYLSHTRFNPRCGFLEYILV